MSPVDRSLSMTDLYVGWECVYVYVCTRMRQVLCQGLNDWMAGEATVFLRIMCQD